MRPLVFCNVAMTVDGKIGPPDRRHVSLGSEEDRRRMAVLRSQADAVVVGGATFRAFSGPLVENAARLDGNAPVRSRPVLNAVVTRTFDVPVDAAAFRDARVRVLLLGPQGIPEAHLAPFRARTEILQSASVTPSWVLDELQRRGAERVLLESGGQLTGEFFRYGLVDELYVTLVPRVLGGVGAPTPVDGNLFPLEAAPSLELLSCEQVGQELFLHYRVVPQASSAAPVR